MLFTKHNREKFLNACVPHVEFVHFDAIILMLVKKKKKKKKILKELISCFFLISFHVVVFLFICSFGCFKLMLIIRLILVVSVFLK